jgi:NurA domain
LELAENKPFAELPEALVEEMLGHSTELASHLLESLNEIRNRREEIRSTLRQKGLLANADDLISSPKYPTCSGVDGSYALERLVTTDLVVAAALAVEGLTPPTEKRHWPRPHHDVITRIVSHSDATTQVIRALMVEMELELAAKAPHDVTFLDGSMATPLIYLNQGLTNLWQGPIEIGSALSAKQAEALKCYEEILSAPRSDKDYAAVPKYTSKKEIVSMLDMRDYEDRGLLTLVLKPGELTEPLQLQPPDQPYHLPVPSGNTITALLQVHVLYYRPYGHMPALRIEVPQSIAKNSQRLANVIEAVRLQCGAPGMFEPYPLYLADRMVKHLSVALPAIRRATTQQMAAAWPDDMGEVYLSMHGYRTERGA